MMLLVAGALSLTAGHFMSDGVDVHSDRWSEVDPDDAKVRAALLAFVPTHIRIADRQSAELASHGLELRGNRLFDTRAVEPPKPADPTGKKKLKSIE